METSKILIGYMIYVPAILLLTFTVSRTLFKNSRVFMLDIFHGQEAIALSTNRLFQMGFYLLNIGFGLWILEMSSYSINDSYRGLVETLSAKLGGFSIYLGITLFLHLFLFLRGRRKSKNRAS